MRRIQGVSIWSVVRPGQPSACLAPVCDSGSHRVDAFTIPFKYFSVRFLYASKQKAVSFAILGLSFFCEEFLLVVIGVDERFLGYYDISLVLAFVPRVRK